MLSELADVGTPQRLTRGEALMLEGDRTDFVSFVLSGCFRVSTVTEDGMEIVLAARKAGDIIGEFAVFDGEARSASVWAMGPAEVRIVSGSDYLRYLEEHPRVSLDRGRALVALARESDQRRVESACLDAEARLALRLLDLAEPSYDPATAATVPVVTWTQSDLASLTGVTREAVARVLGRFRALRLVKTRRAAITICDWDGLEHQARRHRSVASAAHAAS